MPRATARTSSASPPITTPLAWPCWFLENHDLPRVATRFAGGATAMASPYGLPREGADDGAPADDGAAPVGKAADDGETVGAAPADSAPAPSDRTPRSARPAPAPSSLMLAALRGTPFVFEGQELGLPNAVIPADRVVDVDGRDPCRAPVPWERPSAVGPGAGFTTGEPWLPFVEDAERLCVAAQEEDPDSTLNLARRVLAVRRATPALQTGTQRLLDAGPGSSPGSARATTATAGSRS